MYCEIASVYHLIYSDWEASIARQAKMLEAVMRERWASSSRVLDVACGVGTQALGLAQLGFTVTASDLSPKEINRARAEATNRDLQIDFSVADMRRVRSHHDAEFDVVICCDNSLPHLTSDDEILAALIEFHGCVANGGGCIITVRDYEKEDLSKQQIHPSGVRDLGGTRWLLWQVWDPRPPLYDVTMYFVEDIGESNCNTYVMRSTYYAIGIARLMDLMREAGFSEVERLDDRFFQPMIVGTKMSS